MRPRVESDRPWLLFATPRSGSWPIYYTLLEYLRVTRGAEGLGELFNLDYQSFWTEGGRLVTWHFPRHLGTEDRTRKYVSPGCRELVDAARDARRGLIEASPGKYFFKLFPSQISPGADSWLRDTFEWVFLERRDLFAQLLSYLISVGTDRWYRPGGVDPEPGSITATREQFVGFEDLIWLYVLYKKKVRPARVIVYEDFCRVGTEAFLAGLGLDPRVDLSGREHCERQNGRDKRAAFRNLAEIEAWYRGSPLQQLAPREPAEA